MAKYLLLAGGHVQPDKDKPVKGPDGKPTGRFEPKRFKATASSHPVIESDIDLVARFGGDKFAYADVEAKNDRIKELEAELAKAKAELAARPAAPEQTASFPGGQVSTGFQASGGPADAETVQKIQEQKGGDAQKAAARAEPKPRDLEAEYGGFDSLTKAELEDIAKSEKVEYHAHDTKADLAKKLKAKK